MPTKLTVIIHEIHPHVKPDFQLSSYLRLTAWIPPEVQCRQSEPTLEGVKKFRPHFTVPLDILFQLGRATLHFPPRIWWQISPDMPSSKGSSPFSKLLCSFPHILRCRSQCRLHELPLPSPLLCYSSSAGRSGFSEIFKCFFRHSWFIDSLSQNVFHKHCTNLLNFE